jgi:energy-coupling factor transporter ATP-binding protein EcfA2
LASLQRNVNILRSSLDANKHLSSEDLDRIRSLLNPSDQALSRVYQNLILDGLRFEKMNDRFDDVKEAHLKTFSWILGRSDDDPDYRRDDLESADSESVDSESVDSEDVDSGSVDDADNDPHGEGYQDRQDYLQSRLQARDNFVNWLEKGNGIFHISGKPGAGKSTLMKYLCQHPQTEKHIKVWSSQKDLVMAKFFFWRPGTEFQKSLKGLLRGLLHCILDQVPELTQSTFPTQWESAKYQRSIQFKESEIQQAFKSLVEQETVFDNHKFVFFIDGLDEFEGKHDDMIRALLSWVFIRPNDIKICVSSREELIFQERFSKCPKMRLHELTRYDISSFVQDALKANEDFQSVNVNKNALARLQNQIIEKSEGVFLWVSLALRTLEQGLLAEDRVTDLEKKISSLPPELDDLFEFIFDSITKRSHPIDCRNAIRTLAIATNLPSTWRSLPLTRYSFLEEYQDDQDFAIKWRIHNLTSDNMRQRLRRARKQVYSRCRGILEVVSRSKTHGIPFREEAVKTHSSVSS